MAKISVLGAGRMGSALVRAFAAAGHSVTVWNRTAAKCKPLEAIGARIATSLVDAVTARDLVIDVVTNYEASRALLGDAAVVRALAGGTLVELASGTPRQAQQAAQWAAERGIGYLDGAMMATPDFIGRPGCTIVYSGPEELYATHQSTLAALADSGIYVGSRIGHANAVDNAILVVLWGSLHGVLQGSALCEGEEFPLAAFGKALHGCWPVFEPMMLDAIARIEARRYETDTAGAATVATCRASVQYILQISEQHGLDLGLPHALERIFRRAVDQGHGESDVAAVYESLR